MDKIDNKRYWVYSAHNINTNIISLLDSYCSLTHEAREPTECCMSFIEGINQYNEHHSQFYGKIYNSIEELVAEHFEVFL